MKIFLEIELEVEYSEYNNGTVRLHELHFPNCTQNILPFLSEKEKEGSAVITLNLQETQLLCILLSETITITKVLAKRLQLNVLPEVLH